MEDLCFPNNSLNITLGYQFEYDLTQYSFPRGPTLFKELLAEDYVKIVAYLITIVGGLLGNISVILTVALNRSMQTTINIYVTNLAVADLMICLCCMMEQFVSVLTDPVYALGSVMCKFNSFTQMSTLTCSVLTMSAISCDRFMAIMFPLRHRITKQRTSLVIAMVWVLSLLVSTPFLIVKKYHTNYWYDYTETRCDEYWPPATELRYIPHSNSTLEGRCVPSYPLKLTYYCLVTVVLFFLPVVIMATAYSLILWRLWRSEVPGERHEANINVQYRAKKRVIKMVFVVLVAFIICWMPLQVILLFSQFGHDEFVDGQLPDWFSSVMWFSYFAAFGNSFLNPIIYGGFNKTFREGFCVVLRCGFRRQTFRRPRTTHPYNPSIDGGYSSVTRAGSILKSATNSIGSFFHPLLKKRSYFFKTKPGIPMHRARLETRSRLTFTTGVNSSPSRYNSKTVNGTGAKNQSAKPSEFEMKPVYIANDGDSSPNARDTYVSISEGQVNMACT